MASFRLTIPAKILLFGAYWVLRKCPAVGSALRMPHFIDIATDSAYGGVRVQSVAPVDLQKTADVLTGFWDTICQMVEMEPVGLKLKHEADFPWDYGWGGSSALLLSLLWMARALKQDGASPSSDQLWEDYLTLKSKTSLSGSGLDVYAQLHGGAWVSYQRDQAFRQNSEMEEMWDVFCTQHPVYFVPMHKKVSSVQAVAAFEAQEHSDYLLNQATEHVLSIKASVQKNQFAPFRTTVRALTAFTFDHVETPMAFQDFFHRLQLHVGKLGVVTGCGALGGDGVLVFFADKAHDTVHGLRKKGWTFLPLSLGGPGLCAHIEK